MDWRRFCFGLVILCSNVALSQESIVKQQPESSAVENVLSRFSLSGYGTVNYHNYFQYDTDEYMKDKIDLERLVLYLNYKINSTMTIKTEFEYEHGGTGVTMEFDSQEEAGEFETEIEQGGEVKLERFYLEMLFNPYINLRVGRFKLHVGLAQSLDRPQHYFTAMRPEMETEILPVGWYETGLQLFGSFYKGRLIYELSLSSGLDASGFSSRNWIKNGYQTRFEMPVAEALALSGRLDYKFGTHKNTYVGLAGYWNNTTPNRPKKDMEGIPGNLKILETHVTCDEKDLRFNAVLLWGDLQNSDKISEKNKNLSNSLNVKRTSVARQVLGVSAEIGYNIMPFIKKNTEQKLYPFFRYDYYDTMYKTRGNVIAQPRWERNGMTGGINWILNKQVVFKAQFQDRRLGSEHIDRATLKSTGHKQHEKSFSLSMGLSF